MNKVIARQFEELEEQVSQVEASKTVRHNEMFGGGEYVDNDLLLKWKVKVKSLLSKLCGEDSQHFKHFEKEEESGIVGTTNFEILKRLKSIFSAAKEDFYGGYLSSVKALVQAEVIDSELEQANELLSSGYCAAAAVIAGVVLETALRDLCDRNGIPHGKLDKMNADLAKASVYNILKQKRITALADIRNSAAHGKPDKFTNQDVDNMIKDVNRFLSDCLE